MWKCNLRYYSSSGELKIWPWSRNLARNVSLLLGTSNNRAIEQLTILRNSSSCNAWMLNNFVFIWYVYYEIVYRRSKKNFIHHFGTILIEYFQVSRHFKISANEYWRLQKQNKRFNKHKQEVISEPLFHTLWSMQTKANK